VFGPVVLVGLVELGFLVGVMPLASHVRRGA
jgi:hypothetical protein